MPRREAAGAATLQFPSTALFTTPGFVLFVLPRSSSYLRTIQLVTIPSSTLAVVPVVFPPKHSRIVAKISLEEGHKRKYPFTSR